MLLAYFCDFLLLLLRTTAITAAAATTQASPGDKKSGISDHLVDGEVCTNFCSCMFVLLTSATMRCDERSNGLYVGIVFAFSTEYVVFTFQKEGSASGCRQMHLAHETWRGI